VAEPVPLLRAEGSRSATVRGVVLVAAVGAGAAALVALGNPGNMGVCGACFVRDVAGSVGLHAGRGPEIFRPEVAGLVLGAFLVVLTRGRFVARSGGYGAGRFALGFWMAVSALVFLGCPFRLLQRLGGGDLNAWAALPAFVVGVGLGVLFEKRGYSIGKTSPSPRAVGVLAPLAVAGLLALFLVGALGGPGPGSPEGPAHAHWAASLAIALGAGGLLALTGFCAVTAARQAWYGRKAMLLAALALIAAYAVVALATGKFRLSFEGQPIAHRDLFGNATSLGLLGFTGALAGGCPVRQLVMAGEGNGDAWLAVVGLLLGGALAHTMGLASTAAGPTAPGRIAVAIGWAFALAYAVGVVRARAAAAPPTPS
jgi:YedE family putative selenium metabolism protein